MFSCEYCTINPSGQCSHFIPPENREYEMGTLAGNGLIALSLIYNCPLLKVVSFKTVFAGLVWLISNHMFGSGDFWNKLPSWFLKILKLPEWSEENTLWQFIPNRPPKHVITSTNTETTLPSFIVEKNVRLKHLY